MNVNPYSPICNLKVLKSVPLDSTYKDTLYFGTQPSQTAYFSGKAKYSFTDFTPIRLQNTIRIPKNAEMLYDCNYLMWQNTNFGNRWFYAFITSISYVNQNMCTVGFEIDVMQTWMFDVYIKPSFVEREMIDPTEKPGDNLVDENIGYGEYVVAGGSHTSAVQTIPELSAANRCIVIAATIDAAFNPVDGQVTSGIYSGCKYTVNDATDAGAQLTNNFLRMATEQEKEKAIVSIFMMYRPFVKIGVWGPTVYNFTFTGKPDNFDGYVPENQKLFTYPYNFLYVTNNEGSSAEYMYEYFSTDNPSFDVQGNVSCNPQVMISPKSYKNVSHNYDEKLVLGNFPQCAYSIDSFKQWIAANGTETALSAISGASGVISGVQTAAVRGTMGYLAGGPVGAVKGASAGFGAISSGIDEVKNAMMEYRHAARKPPQSYGSLGGSLNMSAGIKNFSFYPKQITKQFAVIVDKYFSMYGYATNQVKVPNNSNRPEWNYIKTRGCNAIGSVPFEDIEKIRSIYDAGFTFWHNPDHVGQYDRANK